MPRSALFDLVSTHAPAAFHVNVDGEQCYCKSYDQLDAVLNYWIGRIAFGAYKRVDLQLIYAKKEPIPVSFAVNYNDRPFQTVDVVKMMLWHYPGTE